VPRTSLENQFLLAAQRKANLAAIWINLNSLKAENCWTVGNSNCPYGDIVCSGGQTFLTSGRFTTAKSNRSDCGKSVGYHCMFLDVFGQMATVLASQGGEETTEIV